MTPTIQGKINAFLQSEEALSIINSDDFYFQKAQETFNEFLNYDISEEQKNFLIKNIKEYDDLKQTLEDSDEIINFGRLLFGVISYCDSKAYKKNVLNQYPDKRVLALAFVRMNNWVEQLLIYKFSLGIPDGSIKNAINYLLRPEENFTMLSENHRAQISENLLRKIYDRTSFKEDILLFFSDSIPELKNRKNHTHLLSRICYQIESEWKLNVIGLISPDKTGWQEDAIKIGKDGGYIALWNHKKPNGVNDTLKQLRQRIEDNGYFRIFYTSNYKVCYVAEIVDFITAQTELESVKWKNDFGNIGWYNEKFNEYTDGKKSASWVYLAKRIYKVEPGSLTDYKFYKGNSYPSVGGQSPIISINSTLVLKNQKQMEDKVNLLNYKKQIILQGPPGTGKTKLAKEIASKVIVFEEIQTSKPLASIDIDAIKKFILVGQKIDSSTNYTKYTIVEVGVSNISVKLKDSDSIYKPSYNEIINAYKIKMWEGKQSQGNDPYASAIAKYIFSQEIFETTKIEDSEQFKLIQFHPSYTYEDFVRGIVADSKGEKIEYKNVNKLLGKLAIEASKKPNSKYVLIIDEINRANLSSVLGELIYALEYRGEEVESMYDVDGSNKLILPPNLYVIGTMNTADRSVGHIDYAIRRRFAFVDVLPQKLEDDKIVFHSDLFKKVAGLFIKNYDSYVLNNAIPLENEKKYLSEEFDAKDVWLGHSYFLQKKIKDTTTLEPENFNIRVKYEIVPILREYVKDGILNGKAIEIINEIEKEYPI